jgi:hypothetical protein
LGRKAWLLITTFCLAVVQEICARMGAVTGKGLSDLIRENFGLRWTFFRDDGPAGDGSHQPIPRSGQLRFLLPESQ